MRKLLMVLSMVLWSVAPAAAQVSVAVGVPGVSVGINLPVYPQLVRVPGYPVYYAPQVRSNYFFYDGMYWVYQGDNWYASSWYNGPWGLVGPEAVPLYVLRVPVRYYRQPPVYFSGWRSDAPPRWGEHWGNSWEQSHYGWDNWNRSSAPAPAPLPSYQRQYSGNRYPHGEQQQALQSRNYRYQPQDAVVQQHYQRYQTQHAQRAPASAPAQDQRGAGRASAPQYGASPASRSQPPQSGGTNTQSQGSVSVQAAPQQARPAPQQQTQRAPAGAAQHSTQAPMQKTVQREQSAPGSHGKDKRPQGKGSAQQPGHDQDKRSQGKGSAQEPREGHDKGEPQRGDLNK
jgi:hypothetical protein